MSMDAQISCRRCDEEIVVSFDYEPAQWRTWMDPGYPPTASATKITGCNCEQDDDVLEEDLIQWVHDRAEDCDL